MNNKVRIATVQIEDDHIILGCICPLIEVSDGDTVQLFLNHDFAVGKVLATNEVWHDVSSCLRSHPREYVGRRIW